MCCCLPEEGWGKKNVIQGENEEKAASDPDSSLSLTFVFGFLLCFSDRCKCSRRDSAEGGMCVSCSV